METADLGLTSNSAECDTTVMLLQTLVELDKTALARAIHDEMGGYLIACAMDVTHLRHQFAAHDEETRRRFDRLSKDLNGAIDMMRRVTEELHPTLLDNVGLFAALRWRIKHMCSRSNIECKEYMPESELLLSQPAAIMLYRAGQELLTVAAHHGAMTKLNFTIETGDDNLMMQALTDGTTGPSSGINRGATSLAFLRHRINAMRGDVSIRYPDGGGISLTARVSMAEVLALQHRTWEIEP